MEGHIVQFNADGEDSYSFAEEFYRLFVDSFDKSCEHISDYDRVQKVVAENKGETYWMDAEKRERFSVGTLICRVYRRSVKAGKKQLRIGL